jgi:[NiFe] hydrogenase diaphorase moiety small subunit
MPRPRTTRCRDVCPVGCIIRKRVGFVTCRSAKREFDKGLIGYEIEDKRRG